MSDLWTAAKYPIDGHWDYSTTTTKKKTTSPLQPVCCYLLLLSSQWEAEPNSSRGQIKSASLKHSWKFPPNWPPSCYRYDKSSHHGGAALSQFPLPDHVFRYGSLKKIGTQKHQCYISVGAGDHISAALHGSLPLIQEVHHTAGDLFCGEWNCSLFGVERHGRLRNLPLAFWSVCGKKRLDFF